MNRLLSITLILTALCGLAFAANELRIDYPTGATIIAAVTNSSGQWWDTAGAAFETFNAITDYDIALSDAGGGIYLGTMPAVPQGVYTIKYYISTTCIAVDENYNWSGTTKLYPPVDVNTIMGDPPVEVNVTDGDVHVYLDDFPIDPNGKMESNVVDASEAWLDQFADSTDLETAAQTGANAAIVALGYTDALATELDGIEDTLVPISDPNTWMMPTSPTPGSIWAYIKKIFSQLGTNE